MIHSGHNRDSLVTPADARTFDLMLQLRLQLVRCEPTSHFNVSGTHCNGNGILHDEFGDFHLDPWQPAEWAAFRSNVVPILMRYWDRKFELTPSRPWYERRAGEPAVAARFTCSLSLQLVDTRPGTPIIATSSSSPRRRPSVRSPAARRDAACSPIATSRSGTGPD